MSGDHRWADIVDNLRFLKATGVDRHLGMICLCPLIECCHNEPTDEGDRHRYPDLTGARRLVLGKCRMPPLGKPE